MRKKNSLFSKFYIAICFAFFYLSDSGDDGIFI